MRQTTYFIRAGTEGPIKIGKANSVECRLQALQTAHYEELSVLAVVDDETERSAHRRFAADRIRGEWFFPSEPLLAYVTNSPGARAASKQELCPMSRVHTGLSLRPVDKLIEALTEYGASFLPGDLLRMINGARTGPHNFNRLTKQNAVDMAVLFTARYARIRSHEEMILETEATLESSSRVIELRKKLALATNVRERVAIVMQLHELGVET